MNYGETVREFEEALAKRYIPPMKTCTKCGESKLLEAFHRNCGAKDGWHPHCKACRRAYQVANPGPERAKRRRYYLANGEKERAQMRQWCANNRERKRAMDRRYHTENAGAIKVRASVYNRQHRKESNARVRRFTLLNPEKVAAWQRSSRARRMAAPGRGIGAGDWRRILADAFGHCTYCGVRHDHLTLDHVEPLASGGAHEPENAVAACRFCNNSKNDTPLVVWLVRRLVA